MDEMYDNLITYEIKLYNKVENNFKKNLSKSNIKFSCILEILIYILQNVETTNNKFTDFEKKNISINVLRNLITDYDTRIDNINKVNDFITFHLSYIIDLINMLDDKRIIIKEETNCINYIFKILNK